MFELPNYDSQRNRLLLWLFLLSILWLIQVSYYYQIGMENEQFNFFVYDIFAKLLIFPTVNFFILYYYEELDSEEIGLGLLKTILIIILGGFLAILLEINLYSFVFKKEFNLAHLGYPSIQIFFSQILVNLIFLFWKTCSKTYKQQSITINELNHDVWQLSQQNYQVSLIGSHSLKNSIVNIRDVIAEDPALARKMLLSLHQILDYYIYELNKTKIALNIELEFINAYFQYQMQNERYLSEDYNLNYQLPKFDFSNDEDFQLYITPGILINYIENAFQHGFSNWIVATAGGRGCFIDCNIKLEKNVLTLIIENSYATRRKITNRTIGNEGFGMIKTEKILKEDYPSDMHTLRTSTKEIDGQNIFQVTLILKLNI